MPVLPDALEQALAMLDSVWDRLDTPDHERVDLLRSLRGTDADTATVAREAARLRPALVIRNDVEEMIIEREAVLASVKERPNQHTVTSLLGLTRGIEDLVTELAKHAPWLEAYRWRGLNYMEKMASDAHALKAKETLARVAASGGGVINATPVQARVTSNKAIELK